MDTLRNDVNIIEVSTQKNLRLAETSLRIFKEWSAELILRKFKMKNQIFTPGYR